MAKMALNDRFRDLAQDAIVKYISSPEWIFTDSELVTFVESILAEVDQVVDNLYHVLPIEQAAGLLTLDEQLKDHFYGIDDD